MTNTASKSRVVYLAYALVTVFSAIALVHFYWALGGRWGFYAAIPQRTDGMPLFQPKFIESCVIGIRFLCFGYVCLAHVRLIPIFGLERFTRWAVLAMGVIFLLRFVGDGRYFGVLREISTTAFAYHDRLFFTPLCLALAIASFVLGIAKRFR